MLLFPIGSEHRHQESTPKLKLWCSKRITAADVARFQACHKPACALCGGAMRECVWDDIALRLPLQSVISNRCSCLHRGFNVAGFDKPPFFFGAVCPDAG